MKESRLKDDLAPLREERWQRGSHFERLRTELARRATARRSRRPLWFGALFLSGAVSGYAFAQVLPSWRVTFLGEEGSYEAVLAPVDGRGGAPEGILRSDSGELYEVELIDGRLVMRRAGGDGKKGEKPSGGESR